MHEIYGGATVTLVIASSWSVNCGFLKERQTQYIHVQSWIPWMEDAATESSAKVYLSPEWDKKKDTTEGPWSMRGWTMQEDLLSSRQLCYTSSQVIWKCSEEERFERGVTKKLEHKLTLASRSSDTGSTFESEWIWSLDTFLQLKQLPTWLSIQPADFSQGEPFRLWCRLIEKFSPRIFTNTGDRLIALSGVAKVYGGLIGCDEYVVGLWKPDLLRGLMWYTEGSKLIPRNCEHRMRAFNDAFPSWSWASVAFELVRNHVNSDELLAQRSTIEDVQINLVDPCQPFGAVKSGSITLRGPLKRLSSLYNEAWKSADVSISKLERHLSKIVEMESPNGVVDRRYISPPGGHFAALQMLKSQGSLDLLVLEATGDVSSGTNIYHRVGLVTLPYRSNPQPISPAMVALRNKAKASLTSRLGPRGTGSRRVHIFNEIVAELEGEKWGDESVIMV